MPIFRSSQIQRSPEIPGRFTADDIAGCNTIFARRIVADINLDGANDLLLFCGRNALIRRYNADPTSGVSQYRRFSDPVIKIFKPPASWLQFAVDYNSDGTVEWLVEDAVSDTHYTWNDYNGNKTPSQFTIGQHALYFLDANGDGLQDAVNLVDKSLLISTGSGFHRVGPLASSPYEDVSWHGLEAPRYVSDFQPANLNGDGRDDFVIFMRRLDHSSRARVVAYVSRGTSFQGFVLGEIDVPNLRQGRGSYGNVGVFDFNGDGISDLAYPEDLPLSPEKRLTVRRNEWDVPDQLSTVEDNTGTRTVSYSGLSDSDVYQDVSAADPTRRCSYPIRCDTPRTLRVVSRHTEPTTGVYTHQYSSYRYDVRARQSLGFRRHTVRREHDGQLTVVDHENTERESHLRGLFYRAGLPSVTTTYTPLGDKVHVQKHTVEWRQLDLESSNTRVFSVVPSEVVERAYDLDASSLDLSEPLTIRHPNSGQFREVRHTSSYDDWGNLTTLASQWDYLFYGTARTAGASTFHREFQNDVANWRIGQITRVEFSETGSGGYSSTQQTRTTTFEYDANGLLSKQTRAPGDSQHQLISDLDYDAYGNLVSVVETGISGSVRSLTRAYEESGTFLLRETNSLGHAKLYGTHPNLGLPILTVDPNSAEASFKYDGFGRIRESAEPTGHVETTSYAKHSSSQRSLTITQAANTGATAKTHFDNHGRVAATLARLPSGEWSRSNRIYSSDTGRMIRWTRPRKSGSAIFRVSHDNLGRVTRFEYPDGTKFDFAYDQLAVTTTHPSSGTPSRSSVQEFDGKGRLKVVRDYGQSAADGDPVIQLHTYGAFDQLTSLRLSSNKPSLRLSTWSFDYDAWSNLEAFHDPDAGTQTFGYNEWFERMYSENASGQRTDYIRDGLGRVDEVVSPEGVADLKWDGNQTGVLGRLRSIRSSDFVVDRYEYLQSGQLAAKSRTVRGRTFRTEYNYQDTGLLNRVDLLMGGRPFSVHYAYNRGVVEHVTRDVPGQGSEVWWQAFEHDGEFRPTNVQLNGGTLQQTSSWDPGTGSLAQRRTESGAGSVQDVAYQYDDLLLQKSDDRIAGETETFDYDYLNRMKRWDSTESGAVDYTFDHLGNLRQRGSDVLEYAAKGPHTLTAVNGESVSHDASGRRTNGRGIRAQYTSFDKPRTLNSSLYRYAADQTRAWARSPNGEVFLEGDLFERRELNSGANTDIYRVVVNGEEIAQVVYNETSDSEEVHFLHRDRLGRVHTVTDKNNNIVAGYQYAPFGERQQRYGSSSPESSIQRAFGLQEYDLDQPVIDMGGRVMVPGEGRFLTPDPLWAASQKPTAFNRYGLSHGNPVNLVDPDGRQPGPRDTGEDNAFLLFLSIAFGGGYQDVGWADLS